MVPPGVTIPESLLGCLVAFTLAADTGYLTVEVFSLIASTDADDWTGFGVEYRPDVKSN